MVLPSEEKKMMRESSKNHAGIMARLAAEQKYRHSRLTIRRKPLRAGTVGPHASL
jgi:hypothetical protein